MIRDWISIALLPSAFWLAAIQPATHPARARTECLFPESGGARLRCGHTASVVNTRSTKQRWTWRTETRRTLVEDDEKPAGAARQRYIISHNVVGW